MLFYTAWNNQFCIRFPPFITIFLSLHNLLNFCQNIAPRNAVKYINILAILKTTPYEHSRYQVNKLLTTYHSHELGNCLHVLRSKFRRFSSYFSTPRLCIYWVFPYLIDFGRCSKQWRTTTILNIFEGSSYASYPFSYNVLLNEQL